MTRLGDIAEIIMGQSPMGNTYNQDGFGVPLLNGPTEFGSSHPIPTTWTTEPTKICEKNDILFCVRGSTTGKMNWADQKYCIGRGLACFRAKTDVGDTKFLFYSLKQNLNSILSLAAGSVFPNLSRGDFEKYEIFWPETPIRKEISEILVSFDDKIELNKNINQTVEEMAQTIFKSWFVDFDPIRAKIERRDIGLPDDIADLFPDSFEESSLGEIPNGWKISTIGDEVKVVGGGTPSTKESKYWEKGIHHWATPKDLSGLSSPILIMTERLITNDGLQQVSSGLLPKGTVLLSSRAPIGYTAITNIPTAINQGFIAMICGEMLPNIFTLFWTQQNIEGIKARANGTTFQEISKSNFKPIQVVVPDKLVVDSFLEITKPMFGKITSNLVEIMNLEDIRNFLLPKIMTVEIEPKQFKI